MKFLSMFVTFAAFHLTSYVEATADQNWAQYLSQYPRQFLNIQDQNMRKSLFLVADANILKHNSGSYSYTIGHSIFSIMTEEEKQKYLGRKFLTLAGRSLSFESVNETDERALPILKIMYDLRTATACGKKIPVKDQGKCGSCWAFSALAPIEYAQCVKSGGTYTLLSEQQLVSCDTNDGGCNGGDPSYAYKWLLSSSRKGAVATSASYSYASGTNGVSGTCKNSLFWGLVTGATLKNWTMLQCAPIGGSAVVTSAIMSAINTYGVVSNCVLVVGNFYSYKSGVYSDPRCSSFSGCGPSSNTNHCTSLVGWGHDKASKKDYWILRNQWGTNFGNGGYMWIEKGVNMCGIESEIYYTIVA